MRQLAKGAKSGEHPQPAPCSPAKVNTDMFLPEAAPRARTIPGSTEAPRRAAGPPLAVCL